MSPSAGSHGVGDTAKAFQPSFPAETLKGSPMGAQLSQAGYCPVYENLASREEQANEASPPSTGGYRSPPSWLLDHVYQPS